MSKRTLHEQLEISKNMRCLVLYLKSVVNNDCLLSVTKYFDVVKHIVDEKQLSDFLEYNDSDLTERDICWELADAACHKFRSTVDVVLSYNASNWFVTVFSFFERLIEAPKSILNFLSEPKHWLDTWKCDTYQSPLDLLLQQKQSYCVWLPKCQRLSCFPKVNDWVVLPGSFHPLHEGHILLAKAAHQLTCRPACFELSIQNADKGTWKPEQVLERLAQFTPELGYACIVTSESLFYRKAKILRGASFVVGFDTAVRILDPKYYGGREEMTDCLRPLPEMGTKVFVAGRVEHPATNTGRWMTLEDLSIPLELQHLFYAIPSDMFRCDISSTMLRKQEQMSKP
eukprot:jgi/Galph1/5220/GphlegSOOS_G3842.1